MNDQRRRKDDCARDEQWESLVKLTYGSSGRKQSRSWCDACLLARPPGDNYTALNNNMSRAYFSHRLAVRSRSLTNIKFPRFIFIAAMDFGTALLLLCSRTSVASLLLLLSVYSTCVVELALLLSTCSGRIRWWSSSLGCWTSSSSTVSVATPPTWLNIFKLI